MVKVRSKIGLPRVYDLTSIGDDHVSLNAESFNNDFVVSALFNSSVNGERDSVLIVWISRVR